MTAGERRYVIVGAMLLISASLSWALARARSEEYDVMLKDLPAVIGPWQGRDVDLKRPDLVYAVLETSSVLSRVYRKSSAGDAVVDLLITFFKKGHRGFHPPETSFVASGNTIVRTGVVTIRGRGGTQGVEANMFLGRTPDGETLFLYWFIVGERSMASYYKSSTYLVWDAIRRRPSSGSMVRVALPLVNGDFGATMGTAEEFIGELLPLLPRYLVERPRPEPGRVSLE